MLENGDERRLVLVSCVKTKGSKATEAKSLYTSDWFRKARAYTENTGCPWLILSAEYGLVHPNAKIRPYEKTLRTMPVRERRAWSDGVLATLGTYLDRIDTVVLLAGQRYREFLEPTLRERGFAVRVPARGLAFGKEVAWLGRHLRD